MRRSSKIAVLSLLLLGTLLVELTSSYSGSLILLRVVIAGVARLVVFYKVTRGKRDRPRPQTDR